MSDAIFGLLGFAVSLGMIALGLPIAVALGIVGIAGYAFLNGVSGASPPLPRSSRCFPIRCR